MSFTTFVSMVSTSDHSKLFLNNLYKFLKLRLFVYISQLRKSIPCGPTAYIQGGGGGNMFVFRKGNLWKKQHIEWAGKYFGLQKGRHGKGPTYIIKLNRALNIVFYQTWGEDSLKWGWDITHVEEIWYIIKLNRALNIVFY